MNITYNFRLGPEAVWLIVNTVLGTVLVELLANLAGLSELPSWDNVTLWASALAVSAIRTAIGAILAVATGGGFQSPGQPKPPQA